MPSYLRWMHWASPMKYVHEILLTATFRGYDWGACEWAKPCYNTASTDPLNDVASGRDILTTMGSEVMGYPDYRVDNVDVVSHACILLVYILVYRIAFLHAARRQLVA